MTSLFLCSFDIHTNNDIIGDIPTFRCPSIRQPLGTLLGTSHLFCCPSIGTQIMTSVGIPQHFVPINSQPNRDTFRYIQLVCHRFVNLYSKQNAVPAFLIAQQNTMQEPSKVIPQAEGNLLGGHKFRYLMHHTKLVIDTYTISLIFSAIRLTTGTQTELPICLYASSSVMVRGNLNSSGNP